ncbi:MAG: hypothetical protein MJY86_04685 [Bacteroidales bacterium]|nr:hypothetical protein [Bacteroidales bacterium]
METREILPSGKHVVTVIALTDDVESVSKEKLQKNDLQCQDRELRDYDIPDSRTAKDLPKTDSYTPILPKAYCPEISRAICTLSLNAIGRIQLPFEATLQKVYFAVTVIVKMIVIIDPVWRKQYS